MQAEPRTEAPHRAGAGRWAPAAPANTQTAANKHLYHPCREALTLLVSTNIHDAIYLKTNKR